MIADALEALGFLVWSFVKIVRTGKYPSSTRR